MSLFEVRQKFEVRIFVYTLIFLSALPCRKNNNKYSKFDTSKSISYQGHQLNVRKLKTLWNFILSRQWFGWPQINLHYIHQEEFGFGCCNWKSHESQGSCFWCNKNSKRILWRQSCFVWKCQGIWIWLSGFVIANFERTERRFRQGPLRKWM